jgi:hypothetical protein
MPVARGPRVDARSALVVGASGVVVALVILAIMLWLSSQNGLDVRLGDDRFQDLAAESAAQRIAANGPLPFRDLAGGSRDIYVQHLGDDPETGWLAFAWRPVGEADDCAVEWHPESRTFVDNGKCTRPYRLPEDGTGLPQYPATVNNDGKVVVDLNAADRESDTTTTVTTTVVTTTTVREG